MIGHVILTVSDFERSVALYAKALKPLGITNFTNYEGHDGHYATWVRDSDGHDIEVVHKS